MNRRVDARLCGSGLGLVRFCLGSSGGSLSNSKALAETD
jgi:hypothetical protein